MTVLIELAVGDPRAGTRHVSPADADALAAIAQDLGATGLRLVDRADNRIAVDPSVAAAYLAGRHHALTYVIDAATTHNAPYNLARRVLSFDRATGGGVGLVLRPGSGDEVSDAVTPDPHAADPAERWLEYVDVLAGLWVSFPREALLGDQEQGVVADVERIRPIDHAGRFYRVAGPLDGPASVHGRPAVIAADSAALGWDRVAAVADAVIVDADDIAGADAALTTALEAVGRRRSDVALLGRIDGRGDPAVLREWASAAGVDGFVLAPTGDAASIADTVRRTVPAVASPARGSLHSVLRRRELAGVPA
ncbi:LLM class flavin-dependent oxidoreductase [Rhodococcus sp. NPDC003318]|uniref:LLM class flavin-dependent oxidoreductase n=1 Tax=Rhodococcus sp. NPDC003318 TaxID=3364503 RepID=UPI00369B977B